MRIGIFDSGRGGEFVADDLRQLVPRYDYIVVNDRENVPYGSRTSEEIIVLTTAAIQPLLQAECQIIVIACNTATMAAIATLRSTYPDVQFVGIEPMIKPAAAQSKTKRITVLATPLTLASERYQHLKHNYGSELVIDQPDTSGWAAKIEICQADHIDLSEVAQSIAQGSDVIVLACTHYHTLAARIATLAPSVAVLHPTKPIAERVSQLAATMKK